MTNYSKSKPDFPKKVLFVSLVIEFSNCKLEIMIIPIYTKGLMRIKISPTREFTIAKICFGGDQSHGTIHYFFLSH